MIDPPFVSTEGERDQMQQKIKKKQEFLLWLSDNEPTYIHEDTGTIPGLTQLLKNPALL